MKNGFLSKWTHFPKNFHSTFVKSLLLPKDCRFESRTRLEIKIGLLHILHLGHFLNQKFLNIFVHWWFSFAPFQSVCSSSFVHVYSTYLCLFPHPQYLPLLDSTFLPSNSIVDLCQNPIIKFQRKITKGFVKRYELTFWKTKFSKNNPNNAFIRQWNVIPAFSFTYMYLWGYDTAHQKRLKQQSSR